MTKYRTNWDCVVDAAMFKSHKTTDNFVQLLYGKIQECPLASEYLLKTGQIIRLMKDGLHFVKSHIESYHKKLLFWTDFESSTPFEYVTLKVKISDGYCIKIKSNSGIRIKINFTGSLRVRRWRHSRIGGSIRVCHFAAVTVLALKDNNTFKWKIYYSGNLISKNS